MLIAFSSFCVLNTLRCRKIDSDVVVASFAALSVVGVFALNYMLTGEMQFSSVAQKGYFKDFSLCSAVYASAIDFMHIVKAYMLGIPRNAPRDFFYIPVIGATFLWIGIFARSWRNASWRELAWYFAKHQPRPLFDLDDACNAFLYGIWCRRRLVTVVAGCAAYFAEHVACCVHGHNVCGACFCV